MNNSTQTLPVIKYFTHCTHRVPVPINEKVVPNIKIIVFLLQKVHIQGAH